MSHLQLDALREKLLRAGIAPRHVRRYLGELRQHFDDLLRAETANGLSGEAAFQAARARLGSDDDLAAATLARPELRSISARFPWAVFGIAPVALLALLILAAVLVEIGLMKVSHGEGGPWPDWVKSSVAAWDWSMMHAFPVIVAAIFYCIGARQLISMRWLISGPLLIAVLGATVTCTTILSDLPGRSAFSVSFVSITDETTMRVAVNVVLVGAMSAIYWLWQRKDFAATS